MADTNKIYAVLIMAALPPKGDHKGKTAATISSLAAPDVARAEAQALVMARRAWPTEEGWREHQAGALVISQGEVTAAYLKARPGLREQIRTAIGNHCACPVPPDWNPAEPLPSCQCDKQTEGVMALLAEVPQ